MLKEYTMQKRWETVNTLKIGKKDFDNEEVIKILLENRGLTNKKDIETFLHPDLTSITPKSVGIDQTQLKKAIKRIEKAIKNKEQIVVFGDYDVDGITGSAILWETLNSLGANVMPYIPHRKNEGYGLSIRGIDNLKTQNSELKTVSLIITVDNGIVANEAVVFANENNIDVIITDHHTTADTLPDAYAIVHTTNLCGAGVAYLLSKELRKIYSSSEQSESRNASSRQARTIDNDTHLELAALGTVADLVPLIGANRTIVFEGLKKLQTTRRPGLLALFQLAKIEKETIGVYEIGFIIGPRLNASGRIESAMDSLRLLCTTNKDRAGELAAKLESTNRERQQLLKDATEHAIGGIKEVGLGTRRILMVGHASYEEGVIGLVAGRLVEAFYRPSIVLSIGEKVSKGSVRSVNGFNVIEFLRLYTNHFINLGGHPMAAGFTVENIKAEALQKALEEKAEEMVTEELLVRSLKIDCELPFDVLTKKLFENIQKLSPFGMGNPEPVFVTKEVTIDSMRILGKDGRHLKLVLRQNDTSFEAIAFGMSEFANSVKIGDTVDVAYVLDENTWNGETKLQLKIKDIHNN